MNTTHHDESQQHTEAPAHAPMLSRATKATLLMVALIGGFYLLREHWNHLAGNWVYLILLACPLMHLFHGHGGHGGGHGDSSGRRDPRADKDA